MPSCCLYRNARSSAPLPPCPNYLSPLPYTAHPRPSIVAICNVSLFLLSTKICNLALQEARMAEQPYYSKGINSGTSERAHAGGQESDARDIREGGSEGGVRHAEGTAGVVGGEGNLAALNVSLRSRHDGFVSSPPSPFVVVFSSFSSFFVFCSLYLNVLRKLFVLYCTVLYCTVPCRTVLTVTTHRIFCLILPGSCGIRRHLPGGDGSPYPPRAAANKGVRPARSRGSPQVNHKHQGWSITVRIFGSMTRLEPNCSAPKVFVRMPTCSQPVAMYFTSTTLSAETCKLAIAGRCGSCILDSSLSPYLGSGATTAPRPSTPLYEPYW